MDEAGGIIAELRQRLEQLDQKVLLYRREMTAEFKKYTEELLRDVPENVTNTVSQAIAESLKRFPLLQPEFPSVDHICGAGRGNVALDHVAANTTVASEIPPIHALSDVAASPVREGQSQLHERERELRGLFTPSYLPLLDVSGHSPPGVDGKPITFASNATGTVSGNTSSPTAISMYPASPTLPPVKPLSEAQRTTEEESLNSDYSDTHGRRSALRRSSSSSKPTSPRHVRFEFEGQEFPTTSSPELENSTLNAAPELVDSVGGPGFDDEVGSQQAEYLDSPMPKRISSTQALRALLRAPLEDDGTKWTEVSAPPDGSASVPMVESDKTELNDEVLLKAPVGKSAGMLLQANGDGDVDISDRDSQRATCPASAGIDSKPGEDSNTLALRKTNTDKKTNTVAEMLPSEPVNARNPTASGATPDVSRIKSAGTIVTSDSADAWFNLNSKDDLDGPHDRLESSFRLADDDGVFAFDEDLANRFENRIEEEEESDCSISEAEGNPPEISQYATSPAVHISKPGTLSSIQQSSTPTQPSYHRLSYHPFSTPIVSEAIHAQAASLGHIVTFVGSLHGASGLDESDLQSFRGSGGIGSFAGGVPLSFSERLAMEDALERQRGDQADD